MHSQLSPHIGRDVAELVIVTHWRSELIESALFFATDSNVAMDSIARDV